MRIIIAGAGNIGFHLAELLSLENKDIILIDLDQKVLDHAATHLDVLTIRGDAASFAVLEQINVADSRLFIAVTTSEKTNLVAAMLAKKMGAKQTIARLKSTDQLSDLQHQMLEELGIDSLISPQQLAAAEIHRLVRSCTFTEIHSFEEGKISIFGVSLGEDSPIINKDLATINTANSDESFLIIALLRGHQTIIPKGNTVLRKGDIVYFISKENETTAVEKTAGCERMEVRNIMIIGGSTLGYQTARLLEKDYNVTLVERDPRRCQKLAEKLTNTLVINGIENDFALLESEGLDRSDLFIATMEEEETNIITCLLAKNKGVKKTIAQVENRDYINISQNIGVDTLINQKLIAANDIFRYVRKGKIEAIATLRGVDAEVIEYTLTRENMLTRQPLRELKLPKACIIGGVIRGDEAIIPDGNFQMQLHDKVIVFTMPEELKQIERIFK